MNMKSDRSEKSINHLEFIMDYEYFLISTDVYRALIISPIFPDGRRQGRFFCIQSQFETIKNHMMKHV